MTTPNYSAFLYDNSSSSWYVEACNYLGQCSFPSSWYSFTTPVAGGGIPATPTDPNPGNTSGPGPTTSDKAVLLSWYGSSDVTSYTVQVTDPSNGALVVNTTTSGTSYLANLNYGKAYSWTVSACDYQGCSYSTTPLYFQTPTPVVETQTDYLSLNGHALAEIATAGSNITVTYLHPDLLGSPRLATDANRNIVWREHYEPYGRKMNGVAEKLGYTGHAYDAESQLTYMQARYYDAAVGRFLSTDPIGFTGNPFSFNRYAYGNDDPYRYIDPTGMAGCEAPTGSHICQPSAGQSNNSATSGSPQVTRTPGHDQASVNLADKHQAEAQAGGREVVKTTYNQEVGKATGGDIPGKERLDSLVESVDQAGKKTYALGEAVSPSQTMASQEAKLADVAGRAKAGLSIKTEARMFMKGSGKLLGPAATVLGAGLIAHDLATNPNYHSDEAFADFFGIGSAQ